MEKYGVVLNPEETEKVKTAGVCPSCRASVSSPYCDNCGVEPFEKKVSSGVSTNSLHTSQPKEDK